MFSISSTEELRIFLFFVRYKKRYQYLKYFMSPKQRGPYDSDAEMHTIAQIENPMPGPGPLMGGGIPGSSNGNVPPGLGMNDDSNHSGKDLAIGSGGPNSADTSFGYAVLIYIFN